ncbi:MAG TPA: O-antigen ligase [Acidobacteriaceae bacterium]|jgi:O-antigen ligase|nr:O-antigen ligase [Acidobacteriaceae bacterium]
MPLEDLACVALFAFFAMQGAIPFIAPAQSLEMTGSAPTSLTTIGGIASQAIADTLIVALILRRPRLLLNRIAGLPWLILPGLLAFLAIASTAWSLDPLLTLRRSIPFALAGLFGLWFAVRFPPARQLAILRFTMIALGLATIAIVILAPSIGLDHTPGHGTDWQGVFTQKNACGRVMVLATAVVLCRERHNFLRPIRVAALALFVFVLVMSGSRAAWMIEAALLLLWGMLVVARHTGQRIRLVLAVVAPLASVTLGGILILGSQWFAPLIGRDLTLTGRTAIWAQVMHFVQQRPLLGYGYDAFWRGAEGPSLQVAATVHFIVAHAHNGFLEIALELGVSGVVLFLFSWLRGWGSLWPLWQHGAIDRIAWPLSILVLIALYDLDENTLLIYNGLFWILYVAALTSIEIAAGDRHHTPAYQPHEILKTEPEKTMAFSRPEAQEPL